MRPFIERFRGSFGPGVAPCIQYADSPRFDEITTPSQRITRFFPDVGLNPQPGFPIAANLRQPPQRAVLTVTSRHGRVGGAGTSREQTGCEYRCASVHSDLAPVADCRRARPTIPGQRNRPGQSLPEGITLPGNGDHAGYATPACFQRELGPDPGDPPDRHRPCRRPAADDIPAPASSVPKYPRRRLLRVSPVHQPSWRAFSWVGQCSPLARTGTIRLQMPTFSSTKSRPTTRAAASPTGHFNPCQFHPRYRAGPQALD